MCSFHALLTLAAQSAFSAPKLQAERLHSIPLRPLSADLFSSHSVRLNRAPAAVEPGNLAPLRQLVWPEGETAMTRKFILGFASAASALAAIAPADAQQWRWN